MKSIFLSLAVATIFTVPAFAQLKLPAVISDHMVMQADQPDVVWGWAPAGATVFIDFKDTTGKTLAHTAAIAAADGRWSAKLPPLKPGAAGQLVVTAGAENKTVQDVLVGETWLCGGQSNMDYRVHSQNTTPEMLETAHKEAAVANGDLRYFQVVRFGADTPQDDVKGEWTVATPDNVDRCSSVAWNFGVALHDKLQRPVALLVSSVGATPAEAWLPREVLDALSCGPAIEKRQQDRNAKYPDAKIKYDAALAAWQAANPTPELRKQNEKAKPPEPQGPESPVAPVRYYNGMIRGLEPYGVKGVIWYQGDGNAGMYQEYPELITTLIRTWRKEWNAELPFYYVEMNNMWELQQQPVENGHNLGPIREAQQAALALPKTDVVATIDLGDSDAITNPHYRNKKPVGQRLAGIALARVYGEKMGEVHSPEFTAFKIEGGKVRLSFRHAAGLRTHESGAVKGFAIRGAQGDWVWADGKIDDTDIIVSSKDVPKPTAVRYAWAANPVISIENGAGLPLRPFRTDTGNPP